ncbi:glycosyltransferase [Tenacibaculum sp. 190524A02b]|uniref:glycosyltransferase n=1 Tax=Tenacibaculum vairaonense TaxID=3137860 RepID=UPI0031FA731F
MVKYFFIDPMSYDNLQEYDINVLSEFKYDELYFFGNTKMEKKPNVVSKLIYDYSYRRGLSKILSYIKSQFKLLLEIKKVKPLVVHFQWFKIPFFDYVILKLIKILSGKSKIVFTAHNILPHNTGDKFFKIFKKIYSYVDKIIVHDFNTKLEICEKFEINITNIEVIQHGLINVPRDKEIVKQTIAENKFKDKIVFSFIGNISEYKGIDLLYKAWKSTKEIYDNKNIQLIIAGRGEEKLIDKFKGIDNVLIINKYLTNDEFISNIMITDIVLMPYRKISQSGVLLTVLNEDKLVIVSDKGGLTEPFKIANVGWILPELSIKELSNTILKASKIEKKTSYINEEDKIKLQDFYSWETISKNTKNLYKLMANEK